MVFSVAFIGDVGYQGDFYASLGSESRNSGVAAAIISEALSNQSKTGHIRTIVNQMTPFIKEANALKVYNPLKTLN